MSKQHGWLACAEVDLAKHHSQHAVVPRHFFHHHLQPLQLAGSHSCRQHTPRGNHCNCLVTYLMLALLAARAHSVQFMFICHA
jgi:hypothetical protein